MKILHICTAWPLSERSGVANYVRSLAGTQADEGNDVWVVAMPSDEQYAFHYVEYLRPQLRIRSLHFLLRLDPAHIGHLVEKEAFEIVHLHCLVDRGIYEAIRRSHYVVSLHDYAFLCKHIYMYNNLAGACDRYDRKRCAACSEPADKKKRIPGTQTIRHFLNKRKHRYFMNILNQADCILPVSYKTEQIYRDSGVTAKSRVLHIGNISACDFEDTYEYNTSPHTIKVVFTGRLTDYKGADLFIRIAGALKNSNVEFHFLGRSGKYSDALSDAGIYDHGSYDPTQLKEHLRKYDIGMVCSLWHDNGPQVVMEMLNNHLPVIGTRMGGIPDFINNNNGYLFDPRSEKEISDAIEWIRELTPDAIAVMRKNITRTRTPSEHNADLMEIYREVIESDVTR